MNTPAANEYGSELQLYVVKSNGQKELIRSCGNRQKLNHYISTPVTVGQYEYIISIKERFSKASDYAQFIKCWKFNDENLPSDIVNYICDLCNPVIAHGIICFKHK